jgi:hypothetical protein
LVEIQKGTGDASGSAICSLSGVNPQMIKDKDEHGERHHNGADLDLGDKCRSIRQQTQNVAE